MIVRDRGNGLANKKRRREVEAPLVEVRQGPTPLVVEVARLVEEVPTHSVVVCLVEWAVWEAWVVLPTCSRIWEAVEQVPLVLRRRHPPMVKVRCSRSLTGLLRLPILMEEEAVPLLLELLPLIPMEVEEDPLDRLQ